MKRRDFFTIMGKAAVTGAVLTLAPPIITSSILDFSAEAAKVQPRSLVFEHLHTGKRLNISYAVNNRYVPGALSTLNSFLRDHRTGAIGRMDPKLFDLLYRLKITLKTKEPFQIVSAYRSPATNAKLCKASRGVAKKSLHLVGKAVDIRVPGVSLATLRDAAMHVRGGGVGFYPRQFVHVDTGPVRNW